MYYTHATVEVKEYIYQQLNPPLKADSIYCLSFFVNLADRSPLMIKTIGAYFSVNTPTLVTYYYINATPQVVNISGFITDTIGWTEIQGCFTAQGGEKFITIGNFNSNANTDTASANPVNPLTGTGNHIAYYYIDSVTLYQNNFPTAINEFDKKNAFSVYPNPTTGILKVVINNLKYKEELTVKLHDVLGKELFNEHYKDEIDISNIEKGIYFLSLYKEERLLETKKIIKE